MVTKNPAFRQKCILLETEGPSEQTGEIIGQWVARLDGAVCTELEPYAGDVPAGKTLLTFSVREMGCHSFYNGYTYVDTMNRDATECYLNITHEKYKARCGDRLGRSIQGIFTDEPHRGSLLDGFGMRMERGEWTAPYTQKLFAEFEKRFGYDLLPKLPELFLQVDGRRISPVKWHFTELLQQLFLENFAIPCNEWCERNNLILTGHVLHEDSLTAQTAMCGSVMRYYEHMGYPGVDVLTEGNRRFWIVKQLQSAARQFGDLPGRQRIHVLRKLARKHHAAARRFEFFQQGDRTRAHGFHPADQDGSVLRLADRQRSVGNMAQTPDDLLVAVIEIDLPPLQPVKQLKVGLVQPFHLGRFGFEPGRPAHGHLRPDALHGIEHQQIADGAALAEHEPGTGKIALHIIVVAPPG
jgi:hypothetical protein